MASSSSPEFLVDLSEEAVERRQQRRRRWLRVMVPVWFVVLILVAILLIAFYSYHVNRNAALDLTEDLLQALDDRIAMRVQTYLAPAGDLVKLAADTVDRNTFDVAGADDLLDSLATQVLDNQQQLAMFNIADAGGNFLMPKKMPDGSIDVKRIRRDNGVVRSYWTRRNLEGEVTGTEELTEDFYDPRTRPWYRNAAKQQGVYWSDPYIFFTDKKPGVTAARAIRDAEGNVRGVLGIDIELDDLCRFLANLKIGNSGEAVIVDGEGRLIAHPDMSVMMKRVDNTLMPVRIDELGDRELTRAWNRFRIEGHGRHNHVIDDQKYLALSSSLGSTVGRDWTVLMIVPEADFVGVIGDNSRNTLLMSIGLVVIVSVLAALLVRQGLRSDRTVREVLVRRRMLERQSTAFGELAGRAGRLAAGEAEATSQSMEILAEAMRARRVGLWAWDEQSQVLRCQDMFDRESEGHTQGTELSRDEFPDALEALGSAETVGIRDVIADERFRSVNRSYFEPLGSRSLLVADVRCGGESVGLVWFEDALPRTWLAEERAFAGAVASVLGVRLRRGEAAGGPATDTAAERQEARPMQEQGREPRLPVDAAKPGDADGAPQQAADVPRGDEEAAEASHVKRRGLSVQLRPSDSSDDAWQDIDDVAVLSILVDAGPIHGLGDGAMRSERLVSNLYVQLSQFEQDGILDLVTTVGDMLVMIAGCSQEDTDHVERIADTALAVHDACDAGDSDERLGGAIRMGMAIGEICRTAAPDAGHDNIWGPAVREAMAMARQGLPGEVQVPEDVYEHLRGDYLLRRRGVFHIHDVGRLTTFLLTGHIG